MTGDDPAPSGERSGDDPPEDASLREGPSMDPIEVADAITECPCSVGDDLTGEIDGGEFADDLDAGALADDGRSDHDLGALTDDERAELERRDYAKVLATIGGLTAVGSLSAPLVGLTRVFEREYTGPIYSDGVALVDAEGNAVDTNFLAPGEHATVFPETHPGIENAPTLLVRFDPGEYGGETRTEWVAEGYAAYSKVCTHAGCMVSEVEGSTLVCPCHFGKFDPLGGGTVVGGPPPRPIPQLPLSVSDDGTLVATGDFESAVGPGGGE